MRTRPSVTSSGEGSRHWRRLGYLFASLAVACAAVLATRVLAAPKKEVQLRTAASFANVANPEARSRALFTEAGKVIQSARCLNCHPAGDTPSQGDDAEPHLPAVVRGQDGHGAVGLRCNTCHQAENYAASGVPGHPKWHTAPIEMAWEGLSLAAICAQIKDPKRNGGMSLAKLAEHMAHDSLVGWAWNPGAGREPVPGTQESFGRLITAWIETGAVCPTGDE